MRRIGSYCLTMAVGAQHVGAAHSIAQPIEGLTLEDRVLDAAEECCARWGITKTTIDDVAREAGVSRATIYRLFPGGKASIVVAGGRREVTRLFHELDHGLADASSLADALAAVLVVISRAARGNSAVAYLVEREPEAFLPILAFDRIDPVLCVLVDHCSQRMRHLGDATQTRELVEWAARMALSHLLSPGLWDLAEPESALEFVALGLGIGPRPDPSHEVGDRADHDPHQHTNQHSVVPTHQGESSNG
ncbi:MAG TPA: hypothetical protein DEG43_11095 [Acidimicrobiaceae bacterium]|nr:hypothetical protein [Acidimicrobiaceae bacterium]